MVALPLESLHSQTQLPAQTTHRPRPGRERRTGWKSGSRVLGQCFPEHIVEAGAVRATVTQTGGVSC